MPARDSNRRWSVVFLAEAWKLRWALVAAALPIITLDLIGVHLDPTNRWAPILHKFGLVGMGLILAHISWMASFGQYIDVSDLLERAMGAEAAVKDAVIFAGAILGRILYTGVIVYAVTMGL